MTSINLIDYIQERWNSGPWKVIEPGKPEQTFPRYAEAWWYLQYLYTEVYHPQGYVHFVYQNHEGDTDPLYFEGVPTDGLGLSLIKKDILLLNQPKKRTYIYIDIVKC